MRNGVGRVARGTKGATKDLVRRLPGRLQPHRAAAWNEWAVAVVTAASPVAFQLADANPVLDYRAVTNVRADFVADPFLAHDADGWHLFCEVLNRHSGRGEIAHAASPDTRSWQYRGTVLREPMHLSYPHVFRDQDEWWMVPEAAESRSVRLYRAAPFPNRWVHAADLLKGLPFRDPTPFVHQGRWWLFAETSLHATDDELRLYCAPALTGPWTEHPASPIVAGDSGSARPAGRVVTVDGRLYRYAQDCRTDYGFAVRALEITALSLTEYAEHMVEAPVVAASGAGWNRRGMHHVDAHPLDDGRWIVAVDGR